jgi:hypothetical protein
MKEIRDIKLDLLMCNENPIVDLFNNITDGIKIMNCNVYNDDSSELIYFKHKEWIFYQDLKNKEFWCNYERYWKLFENEFNLDYTEIQAITKLLVEETLEREVVTPSDSICVGTNLVEEALKREVVTLPNKIEGNLNGVQEALKRELVTPETPGVEILGKVEEVLKLGLSIPLIDTVFNFPEVEEVLKIHNKRI